MRTIGLIGGLSWESTAEYYRLANQAVHERDGGLHSAPVLLSSLDFAEIQHLQDGQDWERLGMRLATEAVRLQEAGASVICLCSNPLHVVADRIEQAIDIPLVHIVDVVAQAVIDVGITQVGLLGTAFTMREGFYRDRLATHGITVNLPDESTRADIDRVIYEELCVGIVTEASRRFFRSVMADLYHAGSEGIVLGCTELELLLSPMDSEVPLFPSTRLHTLAAIARVS